MRDFTPPAAKTNIPTEMLTAVNFMTGFASHITVTYGSAKMQAATLPSGYVIKVGEHTFKGATSEEAFRLFLADAAIRTPVLSRAEIEFAADEVESRERQESDELINELTKEGLSEFGQSVEKEKATRLHAFAIALETLGQPAIAKMSKTDLLDELTRLTGTRPQLEEILELLKGPPDDGS